MKYFITIIITIITVSSIYSSTDNTKGVHTLFVVENKKDTAHMATYNALTNEGVLMDKYNEYYCTYATLGLIIMNKEAKGNNKYFCKEGWPTK